MIQIYAKLFRPRLALLNGTAALCGYCLFPAPPAPVIFSAAFCGVTLLAMGGSALNQLLERDIDALMTRTMLRPLPQGRISASSALLAASCSILGGLVLLAVTGGYLPPLLGAAALAWYLGVYTRLKRRTTLALPLGALCGAFPPLIGWCLAGGAPDDFRITILAGLFFIWQIPHFWLLQERHEADYRLAGIPLVANRRRLLGVWIIALTAAGLMLPAFGLIDRSAAPWYALFPIPLILFTLTPFRRFLFTYLNLLPVLLALNLILRTCA